MINQNFPQITPAPHPVVQTTLHNLIVSAAIILSLAGISTAAPLVPGLYNTGVDSSGLLLATGTPDPHYLIVGGPSLVQWKASTVDPFWLANSSSSLWLSPTGIGNAGSTVGTYRHRLNIDLTGREAQNVSISGRWAADNIGAIFVNGTSTDITAPGNYTAWSPFTIYGGFQPGLNVIEFHVENTGGPTGLRVEFTSVSEDPVSPLIVKQPLPNQIIPANSSATLEVGVFGVPTPALQWYQGNTGDFSNPIANANSSTFTTPSLAATATYWVHASNSKGMVNSATATVTVVSPTAGGLIVKTYDTAANSSFFDPISNLMALAPSGTSLQVANLDIPAGNFPAIYPGLTDDETFSVLWEGWFDVSKEGPGAYTFGTRSNDGSVIYLDLNADGDFADPGEWIVDSNSLHVATNRTGGVTLNMDSVRIAIGYYENLIEADAASMAARFKKGKELDYTQLDPINGASGHFSAFQLPGDPRAANLWNFGLPGFPAEISRGNITWFLPPGTNVTALAPTFNISPGASVFPASGAVRDFTLPQSYTVTAGDGSTKTYTVSVTVPVSDGLTMKTYDTTSGTFYLNPIANLQAIAPSATRIEFGNVEVVRGTPVVLPGLTSNNTFSVLWEGWLDVTKDGPGTYTFGTESDDGSVIYLDLNDDGDFADAGEWIVNSNRNQSTTINLGAAIIERDAVRIAIGFYQSTGGQTMAARFKKGSGSGFSSLTAINGRTGHFHTARPASNPSAAGIWNFGIAGSPAVSDGQAIAWQLPSGTNLASLAPTFSISSGASANPPSGIPRDFTSPQSYTVTAQDGSTKTYVVTAYTGITPVVSYRLGEDGSVGLNNLPVDSALAGQPSGKQDMTDHLNGTTGVSIGTTGVFATGSTAFIDTSGPGDSGWYGADISSLPEDNFAMGIFVKANAAPAAGRDVLSLGEGRGAFKLSHSTAGWAASSHAVTYIGANGVPSSFIPNSWSHLALVRKQGTSTFYVNGIARGSYAGEPNHGLMRLCIDGGTNTFEGQIDEARIVMFHPSHADADILESLHGGFLIPPTASYNYQWNGTTSLNWHTANNWAPANGSSGIAAGPAPTSGSFIHRLSVNNRAGNPLNYTADLGDTVFANPTQRGLVIGSGVATGGGKMTISGGSFSTAGSSLADVVGNSGNTGVLIIDGGNFVSDALNLGNATNGIGRFTMQSGTASVTTLSFNFNHTGSGFVDLNGGRLEISALQEISTGGHHVINFNGGLLKAKAALPTISGLSRANVRDGGVRIDTGAFDITISQQLLHSNIAGDAPVDGGLTKRGTGTLTLTNTKSYTGDTILNEGTLAVSSASFNNAADIVIGQNALLALNHTGTDTVGRLIIAGSSKAAGVWGAPESGAVNTDPHLSGTGTLTVSATVASSNLAMWSGGGDGTSWEDPANWTNGVPLTNDQISISAAARVLYTASSAVNPFESLQLRSGELLIGNGAVFRLAGPMVPSQVGGFGEGPATLTMSRDALAFEFKDGLYFGGAAGGDSIFNFHGTPQTAYPPYPIGISPFADHTATRKSRIQWNFLIDRDLEFLPLAATNVALASTRSSRPNQLRLDILPTGSPFQLNDKFSLVDYSAGSLDGLFLTPDGVSSIADDSIFTSGGYGFRIDYNDSGKITATVVGVPGNHPPVITSQPAASKSVASGTKVNLTVSAIASPSPTYQWYEGQSGDKSNPVGGATLATFTSPVLLSGTSYWVQVSNITGTLNVANSVTSSISISPVPLPNGSLLHRWSFDNTLDSVGDARLTLVGDAAVAGGQLELPGSSIPRTHYGSVNIGSTLAGLTSMTVESWFTLDVLNVWSKVWMFGRPNGGNQPGFSYAYFTPHSDASNPRMSIDLTNSTNYSTGAAPNPATMALATQYHVAAVYDAPANQMRMYINGVQADAASMGGQNVSQLGTTLENFFGASLFFSDTDFGGRINEVRIWNRPLTAAEIASNRTLGPDLLPAPEIAMDDPTASGGNRNFGSALVGKTSQTRTFVVRNTGTTDLQGIQVSLSGENAGDFSADLTAVPTSLARDANASFQVTFSPSTAGTRTATLLIVSNDADENPYQVLLTGKGLLATPLDPASTTMEILAAGEEVFYQTTAPGPGILITWTEGTTNTFGSLYDGSGLLLDQDDDSDLQSNFRASAVVAGGEHFIGVRGGLSTSAGGYLMRTRFIPAFEPVQITYLEKTGNDMNVGFTNISGVPYGMEFSEDLKTWSPISTVPGQGAEMILSLPGHGGFTKRFFRVVSPINFASWAAGYFPGETNPGLTGAVADPDRDGLSNAVELVLGGNPAAIMNSSLLPHIELLNTDLGSGMADYFCFVYRRTDLSLKSGVGSRAQFSSDLAQTWNDAVNGSNGVVVQEDDDHHGFGIDRVRVYIPRGSNPKLFVRMKVIVP